MAKTKTPKNTEQSLLEKIANIKSIKDTGGAYNLRKDGQGVARHSTNDVKISAKTDKPGIDIFVSAGAKNAMVHIPVIITEPGKEDKVYNDFFIGANSNVLIVAGCGIHNDGRHDSTHVGIHSFYIESGATVKYVEKHYGEGVGSGAKILHPETIVDIGEDASAEFEMVQIEGVDSTHRTTTATLDKNARFIINEKLMTHDNQEAISDIVITMKGEDSNARVISRSVAKDNSTQVFYPKVIGENTCKAHVQCDSIIMDNAKVRSIPEIDAYNSDAQLIHEAAIGKIAGDQILKLMTLGLTYDEAEERILQSFLK